MLTSARVGHLFVKLLWPDEMYEKRVMWNRKYTRPQSTEEVKFLENPQVTTALFLSQNYIQLAKTINYRCDFVRQSKLGDIGAIR